jgi:hypothetical protein
VTKKRWESSGPSVGAARRFRLLLGSRAPEPKACKHQEGDDVGNERAAEAQKSGNQFFGGCGMEVFRQIEIDDEQRHREGENAVGQRVESAFRNKLLGLSHCLERLASLIGPNH